ncbi:Hypothetical predicted protein [Paramuricea clavata]|uniref:Uncharacterized protein n=1 Tax=Paramuricea clavata TaxID=317549 RepID=A0A6S7FH68_PARCT|nr:Hypothetical predicted protein [Paramuricea clavata]
MRLCIDLYCKNPHVLDPLRNFIILPSNKTIRLHKNRIQESVGWNEKVLQWCLDEAIAKGLSESDFWGGFALDEMKIQENIEMSVKDGKYKIVGLLDLGEAHDVMRTLTGDSDEPDLATQVLQFIFLSDCGLRFPIAQYPSGNCTPSDLYFLFWEGVLRMQEYGFIIYWCVLDGAECNRQFVKMHFKGKDYVEQNFMTCNVYTGRPMIFIMDPKHNTKKLRNNILKSNASGKPRYLLMNGNAITWYQLKAAFQWDQSSFSLPLHEKLTLQHFELDSASKMRNHLAEDVLDRKMLFLMQRYQQHLDETGSDGATIAATIALLEHTSSMISLFNDKLYINSVYDERLTKLQQLYNMMADWYIQCKESKNLFVSDKLWFDLQSMCIGFKSLVAFKLSKFPNSVIKPAIVNQDCVENHFCQVRACNGQNNNPTYLQQQSIQNSIRFGQTLISKKSNAGKPKRI